MVIEVAGEVDFDSRGLILVQEGGRRWRLLEAPRLLIGDDVTVLGIEPQPGALLVTAIVEEKWAPFARSEDSSNAD